MTFEGRLQGLVDFESDGQSRLAVIESLVPEFSVLGPRGLRCKLDWYVFDDPRSKCGQG